MTNIPDKLTDFLDTFEFITDRTERAEYLIEIADRFESVPARIATSPYPEEHRVPACESDAYVWSEPLNDGSLKFYFAVENPQGLSAQAMAVILDEALSGAPLDQIAAVSPDIVLKIFGRELSMGKGQGLMAIVSLVKREAIQRLAANE